MTYSAPSACITVFPSALGWIAIVGAGTTLRGLTFGHPTETTATENLAQSLRSNAEIGEWNDDLVARLQAYATGSPDDFRDVEIDLGPQTAFQRRIITCCRRIGWGQTITYGQLAARAGYPGASRAVGNCMAANRVALVVPCHRVIGADGRLRGYSSVRGIEMKRRLLEMEGSFSGAAGRL